MNRCAGIGNYGGGLSADNSCIFDSTAQSNASVGAELMKTAVLDGCAVQGNRQMGIHSDPSPGSTKARGHLIRGCAVSGNWLDGVDMNDSFGCLIADNVVAGNTNSGISVERDCAVVGNHCRGNDYGVTVEAVGTPQSSSGNRVQGNTAVSNRHIGIQVLGCTNFIAKNFASRNPTNYDIAAGNTYNDINNPQVAWPWANFHY